MTASDGKFDAWRAADDQCRSRIVLKLITPYFISVRSAVGETLNTLYHSTEQMLFCNTLFCPEEFGEPVFVEPRCSLICWHNKMRQPFRLSLLLHSILISCYPDDDIVTALVTNLASRCGGLGPIQPKRTILFTIICAFSSHTHIGAQHLSR